MAITFNKWIILCVVAISAVLLVLSVHDFWETAEIHAVDGMTSQRVTTAPYSTFKGTSGGNERSDISRNPIARQALPSSISELIDKARSVDANSPWADALEKGWSDITFGYHALELAYTGADLEERKTNLLCFIAAEKLTVLKGGLELLNDSNLRQQALSSVVNAWMRKDPAYLAEYANTQLTGQTRNFALSTAIGALGKTGNFVTAVSYLDAIPYSQQRIAAVNELVRAWGDRDAESAGEWVRKLTLPEERKSASVQLVSVLKDRMTVDALIVAANSELDGELRRAWTLAAGDRFVKADPRSAVVWAEQLSDDVKWRIKADAAKELAKSDLDAGTQMALALSDSKRIRNAIDAIAYEVAVKDIEQGARWLSSLPTTYQERVAVALVTRWYDIDSMRASEWVGSLPAGVVRDRAIFVLATRLATSDLETAQITVNAIGDPKLREAARRQFERR
jgi:hypothetical protein